MSERSAMRRMVVASALMGLAALGGCESDGADSAPTTVIQPDLSYGVPGERLELFASGLSEPVAAVALPDGGLLVAERLTGRVRAVSTDGVVAPDPVAEVEVTGSADDQRGLVGLARVNDGRLFAAWTRRSDGRLVAGEVRGDREPRLIWIGPESADRANGGSLVVLPNGQLVFGVGDLLADPDLADDPGVANRKLLVLDPDDAPDQTPQVRSAGWNNPFALIVDGGGRLWVADNSGGAAPERLGFGDRPATEATDLARPALAPSGLVELGSDRLGLCSYLRDELVEIDTSTVPELTGRVVASPCRSGVTRLADGRVVTVSEQLWVSAGRLGS